MDLDTAYIEPLLEDWLVDIQTAIKREENLVRADDEFYMPFVGNYECLFSKQLIIMRWMFIQLITCTAIPEPIVDTIFHITKYLDLGPDTKYITIHLYDKFMCKYFWEVYKAEIIDHAGGSWTEVCNKISSQSKLYLMSCLQLASKMDSYSKNLTISQWIDKSTEYDHSIVFSSEYKVFQMIGYKIPLCTPINCIEVLLAATGLRNTFNMHKITTVLLDLVYLQKEKLYSHLQCSIQGHVAKTAPEKRDLMALESNFLFLGASIVLCATFFNFVEAETAKVISSKLSELVDIESDNIWDLANVLFVLAIQE
ncbi:cyclin N-terminal domain-containing protein 1 isoform X2 [Augochlora pura]